MKLNEYQELVMDHAIHQDIETNVSHFGFGLAAEAGEVCSIFQKYFRGDVRYNDPSFWDLTEVDFNDWDSFTPEARDMVKKELGDVLWHVAAIADTFGFTLEEIGVTNIKKLSERKAKGTLQGDGDNR